MNVLIICGSRNPDGQTASAVKAYVRGIESGGGSAELVFLPQMNMERCRQCEDHGWGLCAGEGRCVIEDDFASLVEKLGDAGAVVFATPVYWSDLSESLKAFMDRLRRICWYEKNRSITHLKPAVGICVAGGGGGGAPICCVNLERTLGHMGFDVVDMIPARRQNLEMKLKVCEIAGKWLAEGLKRLFGRGLKTFRNHG